MGNKITPPAQIPIPLQIYIPHRRNLWEETKMKFLITMEVTVNAEEWNDARKVTVYGMGMMTYIVV